MYFRLFICLQESSNESNANQSLNETIMNQSLNESSIMNETNDSNCIPAIYAMSLAYYLEKCGDFRFSYLLKSIHFENTILPLRT